MPGVLINPVTRLLIKVLLIGVIAVAHVRAIFVLYPTQNSSLVRFVLPTAAALLLYVLLILRRHWILSFVLALILTGLSLAGGLILAINTYGS